MKQATRVHMRELAAGVALATVFSGSAMNTHAFSFKVKDWDGALNTTVSAGSSWRMEDPDSKLYSPQNGALVNESGGTGDKRDHGNLNYDKGDRFSTVFKFLSELSVNKDYMGAVVRVKGWYDQALEDEDVNFGNQANGFKRKSPLSDSGYDDLLKFSGIHLMDAYIYNTWDINYMPLQVRLGRQVVNWGESLFIQGISQGINPIDVPAFRRPGTELKEVLLPTNMIYTNFGFGDGISMEAFYQFEWQHSPVEGCGHYWSTTENSISPNLDSCGMAVGIGPGTSADDFAAGTYYPQAERNDTRDSGQFGIALRFPVDAIDTEFGLYGINYHSKLPVLSINTGSGPGTGAATLLPMQLDAALGQTPADVSWVYPEDIQLYGISAAANIASWSIGAELTHTRNFPVIINGADLVVAAAQGVGPMGETLSNAGANEDIKGYDRFNKTQLQINGLNLWSNVLGAQTALLIAEVGFQYGDIPDAYTDRRYGRGFTFGFGKHESLGNGVNPCDAGINRNTAGCNNDGYVTDFSWGYRARFSLDYQSPFGLGMLVQPSLFVGHDVKGYSLDGQFQEGRISAAVGTDFTYLKRHKFGISYVNFMNSADYDDLRDRDYASVNYSYSF